VARSASEVALLRAVQADNGAKPELLRRMGVEPPVPQAAECQVENQVRTALGLGGTVGNCYAAAGLDDAGAALLTPVAQRIRDQNSAFPSTTPGNRSGRT
jgi:hypothetical protein